MRFVQAGVMLLGAASYLGFLVVLFRYGMGRPGYADALVIGGWNALLLAVTPLVIVDSIRKARAGRASELARDLFVVKLAAIPFFSINFIVLATFALFGSAITASVFASDSPKFDVLAFGGTMLGSAAIAIGLTYLAMLTTSTYGWAAVAQLRQAGRIGPARAVLYRIMLLLFVLDVVAGILLYVHSRRGEAAL